VVYVLLILFLPYGIVGTWRLRSFQWQQGRERLLQPFGLGKKEKASASDK
jgi:hypothetical protein